MSTVLAVVAVVRRGDAVNGGSSGGDGGRSRSRGREGIRGIRDAVAVAVNVDGDFVCLLISYLVGR